MKTYTYDKNGNQTQVISTLNGPPLRKVSMTYDLFNRNTAWTLSKPDAAGVLTPARTTTYTYRGAQWHRTAITTADDTTTFLYDGANVIADIGAGGALQKTYVTPMLDQNLSVTTYTPTSTGIDTATYYYNADDRQSVHNLTTSTGAIAATYDYTAFGERTEAITSPQLSIVNSPLSIASQRYTYTGRELNPYAGDYYFRYRTYNAGFGAFTARDPLGYGGGGLSLYSGYFALWQKTDPSGRGVWDWLVDQWNQDFGPNGAFSNPGAAGAGIVAVHNEVNQPGHVGVGQGVNLDTLGASITNVSLNQPGEYDSWAQAVGQLIDWVGGAEGPTHYGPQSIESIDMANSTIASRLEADFLSRNRAHGDCADWTNLTDGWYEFDISAFMQDIPNGQAHFVGSARGDARIVSRTEAIVTVEFTLTNTTSLFSLLYHQIPQEWNIQTPGTPFTNWTQTYTFRKDYECCVDNE